MNITKDEVMHVANLARLKIDNKKIDRFADRIGTILEYVDTLNSVDTKGVTPTFNAISLTNAFREDKETEHLDKNAAFANAPDKDDNNFLVPKVI